MPDDGNGPLPEEVEGALESERERFDAEFAALCALLYAGEITLGAWLRRFEALVKVLNVRSALIVARYLGYEELPDAVLAALNEKMETQHEHAKSFAEKILELAALGALPSLAYTLWRGGLYGRVGVGTGWQVWWMAGGNPDDVMIWERHWHDSCPTCISREGYIAKRSDLPFNPRDGTSECGGSCKCSWELLRLG